jgi:hypothetical protein
MANNRINCHKCEYYYVTWDNQHPHGCKALGFKSGTMPSLVVFQSSGAKCRFYSPKNSRKSKKSGKNKIIV